MGKLTPITLLKLGGSMITHKDVPLSVNLNALKGAGDVIRKSKLPSEDRRLALVHGGGSFGHYYAKKFLLSTQPKVVEPMAIAKTNQAMFQLHSILLKTLVNSDVAIETILAQELIRSDNYISKNGKERIEGSFNRRLIPISFGIVAEFDEKSKIISGDQICESLSRALPVDRVIFAMDVDGIYSAKSLDGKILKHLNERDIVEMGARKLDVTGGIESKIRLGFSLAKLGVEVFYVNGLKPERLLNLINGKGSDEVLATSILPSHSRGKSKSFGPL
jgi:isopentenyl phosphate kinase